MHIDTGATPLVLSRDDPYADLSIFSGIPHFTQAGTTLEIEFLETWLSRR
jgi:hypothetical protein